MLALRGGAPKQQVVQGDGSGGQCVLPCPQLRCHSSGTRSLLTSVCYYWLLHLGVVVNEDGSIVFL